MPIPEEVRRAARSAIPGALVVVLVGHFVMTLLYLTPLSPLRVATAGVTNAYIEPLFMQHWELFAPGPADTSRVILFACRLRDDTRADDQIPWLDATTRLRLAHYENRLGFADRLLRAQKAGAAFLAPTEDAFSSAVTRSADPALARSLDEERARAQETGREIYARLASVECDREYGPARTVAVRVRVVTETLPPYSKRNDPDARPTRTAEDLPWAAYALVDRY